MTTVPRRVTVTLEFVADLPPLPGNRADIEADRIGDEILARLRERPIEAVFSESFKILSWADVAEEDGEHDKEES